MEIIKLSPMYGTMSGDDKMSPTPSDLSIFHTDAPLFDASPTYHKEI